MGRFLPLAVLLLVFIFAENTFAQTYCTPSYSGTATLTSFYTHILQVKLNDIDHYNGSPGAGTSTAHYENHTNISTDLVISETYHLTVALGNGANSQTFAVWIDWNQNGVFESNELMFSAYDQANSGNHIFIDSLTVPVTALPGNTRMRVGTKLGMNTPHPCFNNVGLDYSQHFLDFTLNIVQPQLQVFESAVASHPTFDEIVPGSTKNQILKINVRTNPSGTLSPHTATEFYFNTLGTTNLADISNARLFYTGGISTFTNPVMVGDSINSLTQNFIINANQQLKAGNNYFWLVYDVSPNAIRGNSIDARINHINVSARRTLANGNPPGNRKVGYCVSRGTQMHFISIMNVTLDSINSTSTYGDGYSDYTNLSTVLTKGNTYNISTLFGNSVNPGHYRIWIDYNQDGDFNDTGEMIVQGYWVASGFTPNHTPDTHQFTVPAFAKPGPARMRVSIQYATAPGACTNPIHIGEVEDYTVIIREDGQPIADFHADVTCFGTTTNFSDSSYTFGNYQINTWHWNFGNGITSTLQNPQYVYPQPGVYNVTLTVNTDLPGNPASISKTVKVNNPVADFSFTPNISNALISFTDQTVGGIVTNWSWDFGDPSSGLANTDTTEFPIHVFDTAGVYPITLIITTEGSCKDTLVKNIAILNEITPIALFSISTDSPFIAAPALLQDQSLNNPTNWEWFFSPNWVTFINGTGPTSQNAEVLFDSLTTYQVTFIASNLAGSDTVTKTIIIKDYNAPVAEFIANFTNVKAGQSISFTNLSSNNPTSWAWSFGDGDSSFTQHPTHIYSNAGVYSVSLTSTNPAGVHNRTRNNYITVSDRYRLCEPNLNYSPLYSGFISDSGDSAGNYLTNSTCGFLIKPGCAGPITLTFTSFTYISGHHLQVFDGIDETGIPLHPGSGFTGGNIPGPVTANSGSMFIRELTGPFAAPGFTATWNAAPNIAPVAQITADTLGYINSPVYFSNTSGGGIATHVEWDFTNDGITDSTGHNPNYTFTSPGLYTIRLIAKNCAGSDTSFHTINIITPTSVPVSDFYAHTDTVFLFDGIQFFDNSTNGPTNWLWQAEPVDDIFFGNNTTDSSQNPYIMFLEAGEYTVSLTASNSIGAGNTETKQNYIYVKDRRQMCFFPEESTFKMGRVTDDGGEHWNYSNNTHCGFLIDPCATQIRLSFTEFQMASGDYVRVFDGKDTSGIPLHTGLGFTGSTLPPLLIANSGKMFIQQITNASGTSRGFVANWESDLIDSTPTAIFYVPDTVFTGTSVYFNNQSQGQRVNYKWDFNNNAQVDDTSRNPVHKYDTSGTYLVRLTTENCRGTSSQVKTIVVIDPVAAPLADFIADKLKATTTDTVWFTDVSENGVTAWEWHFDPPNITFVQGHNSNSENPGVIFNAAGSYTVSLIATNIIGSDSIRKTAYINVIEYCLPQVNSTLTDIGISEVVLNGIDQKSSIGTSSYSYYYFGKAATLSLRGTYPISISRNSTTNNMTRIVWIDFNQDGIFDDSTEMVVFEPDARTQTLFDTIYIPGHALLGTTKMRVAASNSSIGFTACGTFTVGEVEDYRIIIVADTIAPVISLIGTDTVYSEVGYTFNDPGAIAIDDVEGDISSRIVVAQNIDIMMEGTYLITYNVSDSASNAADEVERVVIITPDQTKPEITQLGDNPFHLEIYNAYVEPGATAFDKKDGDITASIQISHNIVDSVFGTYEVIYTVTDQAGFSDTAIRYVIVGDTTPPVINLVGQNPLFINVNEPFTEPGWTVSDNYYDSTQISVSVSGTFVNTQTSGVYYLIYTAEDGLGNISSAKRDIIVSYGVGRETIQNNIIYNVYPNPSHSIFNLYLKTENPQEFKLIVTDALGKTVFATEGKTNPELLLQLDLSELNSGMYFLRITNQNHLIIKPLSVIK